MTAGWVHERAGSAEWFTPPWVFSALGLEFDLDPCAPPWGVAPWIPARRRFSLPSDGLARSWWGSVWCNPPYGAETARWIGKLAEHGDGLALVFVRSDTPWWQAAASRADAVCFLAGRVEFVPGDRALRRSRSGSPSCLLAFGDGCAAALEAADLGVVGSLVRAGRQGRLAA